MTLFAKTQEGGVFPSIRAILRQGQSQSAQSLVHSSGS
jgi:hypothetical protein